MIRMFFILLFSFYSGYVSTAEIEKCSETIIVIERIAPQYPTDVMEEKKLQFVRMAFNISPEGKVSDVKVLELSNRRFGRTAIRTIKKWLFEPQVELCRHEMKIEWILSE